MWNAKSAAGARDRLDRWYPPFAPMPAESAYADSSTNPAPRWLQPDPPAPPKVPGPQVPTEPNTWPLELDPEPLAYVDDFLGPGRPKPKSKQTGRTRVYVSTAAVAAVVIGGVALAATKVFAGGDKDGDAATAVAVAEETPGASSEWCPTVTTDQLVMGAGNGSQDDGVSVILAFDYAYYVERDGTKARNLMDPVDPAALTAEGLQNAIDTAIPAETQHCLTIKPDPVVAGRYAVQLSERRADGTSVVYNQSIATANHGGKQVITAIEAVD